MIQEVEKLFFWLIIIILLTSLAQGAISGSISNLVGYAIQMNLVVLLTYITVWGHKCPINFLIDKRPIRKSTLFATMVLQKSI